MAAWCLSQARHITVAFSPGRSLPRGSKLMAAHVAMRLAIESLPAPRPATQINSLTRCAGGSRAATAPKAAFSLSDIGSAAAAFRTARDMSQLGPRKNGPASRGAAQGSAQHIAYHDR